MTVSNINFFISLFFKGFNLMFTLQNNRKNITCQREYP